MNGLTHTSHSGKAYPMIMWRRTQSFSKPSKSTVFSFTISCLKVRVGVVLGKRFLHIALTLDFFRVRGPLVCSRVLGAQHRTAHSQKSKRTGSQRVSNSRTALCFPPPATLRQLKSSGVAIHVSAWPSSGRGPDRSSYLGTGNIFTMCIICT